MKSLSEIQEVEKIQSEKLSGLVQEYNSQTNLVSNSANGVKLREKILRVLGSINTLRWVLNNNYNDIIDE
jgi:hypothetical protein